MINRYDGIMNRSINILTAYGEINKLFNYSKDNL